MLSARHARALISGEGKAQKNLVIKPEEASRFTVLEPRLVVATFQNPVARSKVLFP